MEPTAASETSSENSRRTPCKIPKTENQYLFHGESLKSRLQSHGKDYRNVAEFVIGGKCARTFLSIAKAFEKRLKRNWQKKSAKLADQLALYLYVDINDVEEVIASHGRELKNEVNYEKLT